jgi:hypothetical protein
VCVCVCDTSVAILAQATAGPLPLVFPPPAAFDMAESIIAELHGRLLRGIAAETAVHFQGLRAAAGHLRRAGVLDSRLAKKLAAVDCAYAISRHITAVSAEQCVDEVLAAIRCSTKEMDKADKETADEMERFANEKVAKDKAAEEEVAAKKKFDLEQAAVKAAEEVAAAKEKTHLEQVAKEKAAVEKAAEQKAEEEMAAKTLLEQVAKAKAAEKVKADAEIAAKVKCAEEQSARELAAELQAAVDEAEWFAEVEGILRSGTVAFADLTGDEVRRLLACRTKKSKQPAEVKPDGTKVAEKAAEVQPDVAATQQVTEEKAAKKPKVDKFDKVNLELEALAYRIDSMPSAAESLSWQRSGWR